MVLKSTGHVEISSADVSVGTSLFFFLLFSVDDDPVFLDSIDDVFISISGVDVSAFTIEEDVDVSVDEVSSTASFVVDDVVDDGIEATGIEATGIEAKGRE